MKLPSVPPTIAFDALGLVGLVLLAWGLWLIHPSAALVVVGLVLLVGGIAGAWKAGRGGTDDRR